MPEVIEPETLNTRQKIKFSMNLFLKYKIDLKNVYQLNTKRLSTCLLGKY